MRKIAAFVVAASLTACAVGPDYVRPELPEPEGFVRADPAAFNSMEAESIFWRRLDDPLLARLIDRALTANHDLRIGLARLDRARALLGISKFDRLPIVTARAGAADVRESASQVPGVERGARDAEVYDLGIDAFWELDFFGRLRRRVEAQRAEMQAAAGDLAALQVAIVAELAQSYYALRGAQEQLRVARENAGNQRRTLELVTARLEAGRGTEFDTERAQAQLESTLARIPSLEAGVAVEMHRIAVLTGRAPGTHRAALERPAQAPRLPAQVATGTPGELLRRRPDIAAAERRLAAATARIGVATADLFPRFTLSGLIGTQALDTGDLFERDSETRAVALGVDWSFLDVGRVRSRISAADADAAAELASYEQTVLVALEETENSLIRYSRAQRERDHLAEAAAASGRAARLARLRFDGGLVDFLEVLDAERSQLEAEDELAQSRTRAATAVIALYKALAGGWPERSAQFTSQAK